MNTPLKSALQSFLDRLCNDSYAGTMFEGDADTLRDAIAYIDRGERIRRAQPSPPLPQQGGEQIALTVRLAFENIRNNYVGWQGDPNFEVLSAALFSKGMPVTQEPKYGIRDNRLFNRASGEFIPVEEPVFIFRARDVFAARRIHEYSLCCGGDHRIAVQQRADDFSQFATAYPERMKTPDTVPSGAATLPQAEEKTCAAINPPEFPPLPDVPHPSQDAVWAWGCLTGWRLAQGAPQVGEQTELERIEKLLQDPIVVHTNMCAGKIAKIGMRECAHVHGDDMMTRWNAFEQWERAAALLQVGEAKPDYQSAFQSMCADMSAVAALLGLDGYSGIDPVLRAITDLHLKATPASSGEAKAVAPEGWKLVPIEPTDAMAAAAIGEAIDNKFQINGVNMWRVMLAAAPAAQPLPQQAGEPKAVVPAKIYVDVRECSDCSHIGINDESETDAACNSCSWSGPSPFEDHCPECNRDGTMTGACPKCGGRYKQLAYTEISIAQPLPVAANPIQFTAVPERKIPSDFPRLDMQSAAMVCIGWNDCRDAVIKAQGEPVAANPDSRDALRELIARHASLLESNAYCYFELAYTRATEWMAFICDRPAQGVIGTADYGKNRKILAQGQGSTPEDACAAAIAAMQQGEKQ